MFSHTSELESRKVYLNRTGGIMNSDYNYGNKHMVVVQMMKGILGEGGDCRFFK